MPPVFWDSHGIFLVDYLEEGKTINGYYANLLQQLSDKLKDKRPRLAKKKVLFNQDMDFRPIVGISYRTILVYLHIISSVLTEYDVP